MATAPRRPVAWRIHPDDAARFAAERKHCEGRRGTSRCKDPIAIVTWRWYRSAEAGRVLVVERFLCDEHGQEFAARITSRSARPRMCLARVTASATTRREARRHDGI
jgi:hypothetical protein